MKKVKIEEIFAVQENGVKLTQGWSPQCLKEPSFSEDVWGVLKTTAIQQGYFLENENKRLPETINPRENLEVKEGDILLTCAGPRNRCGIACLVRKTRRRLMISGKMYRFRVDVNKTIPEFIELYLQTREAWDAIDKMKTGISDSGLNLTHGRFKQLEIPLPSIKEQTETVSKIEELFSELEKGIENLKLAQQLLKVYRQSVLKSAFEGRLTNDAVKEGVLPEGWRMDPLGTYISDISAGKSITCDERPPKANEFGIVKVSAVSWGFFDESESKTCLSANNYNKEYIIKPGDFLFSRANTIDLVGACVIVRHTKGNLMLSDKILRFKFTKQVTKDFVLYFLRSKTGRRQIEALSTGNQDSMRNIGQAKIRMIQMPYCKLEEQQQIVNEINDRLSITDKMEESINQSLQQSEALRQSILKRAFEGKLLNNNNKYGTI